MPKRVYLFGDESGDLVFRRGDGQSRYFLIATVAMDECALGEELLQLRRELAWQGVHLEMFHATADKQRIRDRVFAAMAASSIRIDATILDKPKTQDHLRANPLQFYKQAWYLHAKYVVPRVCGALDDLFVVASKLQINRKKEAVRHAVADVISQVSPTAVFHSAFFPAVSDPCLQVADYAAWAIQRKWEAGDDRSYKLIEHLVKTTFEPFLFGPKVYY